MKRSEGMIAYTEKRKNDTLKKVQEAITIQKTTGQKVTRKDIIRIAGVSTAVLSKPYVKDLLKENKVLMYEEKKQLQQPGTDTYIAMSKQLEKCNMKIAAQEQKLVNAHIRINNLEEANHKLELEKKEQKREIEMLYGKFQTLLEYIKRNDLDNESIKEFFS